MRKYSMQASLRQGCGLKAAHAAERGAEAPPQLSQSLQRERKAPCVHCYLDHPAGQASN